VTLEEGFIGKGGVDGAIGHLILDKQLPIKLKSLGVKDKYLFHIGSRDYLHDQNDLGIKAITREASI
jgi:transketolase